MAINHFIISAYFTFITTLILGLFVLSRNFQNRVYRIFSVYSFSIAIWSLAVSRFSPELSPESAFIWGKILHFGAIMIPVFFIHFVFVFLKEIHKHNVGLRIAYIFAGLLQALNFFTPWLTFGTSYRDLYSFPTPNFAYLVFFLYFIVCVCYGLIRLITAYFYSKGIFKNQLRYLIIGSLIGYSGGLDNFLITVDLKVFPLYPYGAYAIAFYVFIMSYAIVTARLLDIEVVIKRGIVYSSLAVLLTTVYFTLANASGLLIERFTGYTGAWASAPSILIIALLFEPTRSYLQNVVDRIMFRKRYLYQKVISKYSHALTKPTTDSNRLGKLAPYLVCKAMKLTGAATLMLSRELGRYEIKGTVRGAHHLMGNIIEENDDLIRYVLATQKTIVKDEIQNSLESGTLSEFEAKKLKSILKKMEELDTVLLIPSISESEYFGEPTLLSVFLLGEKRSGEPFSADDISFLEAMAAQATITVEYAIILEELERSREKLVQSEKLAALGTMAAGVAHEIKNPLAALKLFTEVIPLKFDDPDYREKFARLIPSELARLKRILSDLDSFSKPEVETRIAPFLVNDVIEKTTQLLEVQFKKGSVRVVKELKETPKIKGNSSKLMQVFMNIMLNAVHAMERGGVLTVSTSAEGDDVKVSIADTGTGIPQDKIKDIFNPFFTTKETGTGLGLAITNRIVQEHNGKINVESEEGKGTKFIISIPAVEL